MSDTVEETRKFYKRIVERRPEWLRRSWMPEHVEEEDGNFKKSTFCTKFGGTDPFVHESFPWIVCPDCEEKMSFLGQIRLDHLPWDFLEYSGLAEKKEGDKHIWTEGLFQVFHCVECSPYDGEFAGLRIVPHEVVLKEEIKGGNAGTERKKKEKGPKSKKKKCAPETFTEVFVSGWSERERRELPTDTEVGDQDGWLRELGYEEMPDICMDDIDDDENFTREGPPAAGVKLGGYIRWCQSMEFPDCPNCKVAMDIRFLQMEECETLDFMWGDCGTAHVTICPKCKEFMLGWACC